MWSMVQLKYQFQEGFSVPVGLFLYVAECVKYGNFCLNRMLYLLNIILIRRALSSLKILSKTSSDLVPFFLCIIKDAYY